MLGWMVRFDFPKAVRLRKRSEFQRVFQEGVVRKDANVVTYALPTGAATRLGVVVGRKFKGAVRRNRLKRLIREAFRTVRPELPPGLDLVVLPREGAKLTVDGVRESLRRLLARPVTPRKRES